MESEANITTQKEMAMPWTGKSFSKHNKKLSGKKLKVAAAAANAVLKKTGDEGKAIRIGNAAGNKAKA